MLKKKTSAFQTDLRAPLVICVAIGTMLLAILSVLTFLGQNQTLPSEHIPYYALALLGVEVLVAGCVLAAYLIRYRRICAANEAAELMTTEISDMFRYVVDVPYAIISQDGTVKIVSGEQRITLH